MSRVVLWSFLSGAVTVALLVYWRGFFWQHAMIIGIGVAALVYTSFRTIRNLKDLHKH